MSFSKLIKVIGLSPSEMDRTDLFRKLSSERDRVRSTLEWFRENKWSPKVTEKVKKTGGQPATKATTLMKKEGVSVDKLKQALLLMQQEMNKNA